ncbi:UNVERIFIED_CONTAM: hypothetical protein HDU68_002662 [Siphonaria sp. JEL0065]|nr:hypothetical protein HDU68_002662 [Siphonaria sp. JEL0065]
MTTSCHRHRILDGGGSTPFGQTYFQACQNRQSPVLAQVISPALELKRHLHIDVDGIKREEDWEPIMKALRINEDLKEIRLRSNLGPGMQGISGNVYIDFNPVGNSNGSNCDIEEDNGSMSTTRNVKLNYATQKGDDGLDILMDGLVEEIGMLAIDLQYNDITDAGGRIVEQVVRLNGELVIVDLRNNRIDPILLRIITSLLQVNMSHRLKAGAMPVHSEGKIKMVCVFKHALNDVQYPQTGKSKKPMKAKTIVPQTPAARIPGAAWVADIPDNVEISLDNYSSKVGELFSSRATNSQKVLDYISSREAQLWAENQELKQKLYEAQHSKFESKFVNSKSRDRHNAVQEISDVDKSNAAWSLPNQKFESKVANRHVKFEKSLRPSNGDDSLKFIVQDYCDFPEEKVKQNNTPYNENIELTSLDQAVLDRLLDLKLESRRATEYPAVTDRPAKSKQSLIVKNASLDKLAADLDDFIRESKKEEITEPSFEFGEPVEITKQRGKPSTEVILTTTSTILKMH